LYQWGDAIDVKGDADTKRLGTPALDHCSSTFNKFFIKTYFPNFFFFVVEKQFGSIELEN
jgi:hypothetical protein